MNVNFMLFQETEDTSDDDLVTVVEGQQTTPIESQPKEHSAKYQVSIGVHSG